MKRDSKIYVAGHRGMVGSALCRKLRADGFTNIITRFHSDLDLTRQGEVEKFFNTEKPEYVFLAAAKVGGILANSIYPADFICQNLQIQSNIIHSAHQFGTKKLLFLGSSCIYPRNCPQPMKEEYLLTDTLESTNEAYAIAKIAGIKMCQFYHRQYGDNFISVMPTNLYGTNDNFDLETSHVLPALIRKFHEGKIRYNQSSTQERANLNVSVWGSGKPRREFLHVDDMADASLFIMNHLNPDDLYGKGITHINIGTGEDISIGELGQLIRDITGFNGGIIYDMEKPDGTPRKLLDVSRLKKLGWTAKISLRKGIEKTYLWYLKGKVSP
jgi:GDP-L-fucose synthase